MFAVDVLMQYLLFPTLPVGYVKTKSIFMNIAAAVGSSLMAYSCVQSGEGRTPEAEMMRARRQRDIEEVCFV